MKKEFNVTDWVSKNRLKEHEGEEYPPYMYSSVGFGCHVCKYLNFNKDEDKYTCGNTNYQEYMGTYFLIDPDTNTIIFQ